MERLRRLFGLKRDKSADGWENLHNDELHIIKMIKSRRMRWAEDVARRGI
jgi:hypothetical protein